MDKASFAEASKRLGEVNKVIETLDPSIRPAAFVVLQEYVTGKRVRRVSANEEADPPDNEGEPAIDSETAREFLSEHYSDKPSDNVKAIAALFYREFGTAPITASEVTEVAHEAGVTVPSRVDVTLGGAAADKKALFTKVKSGVYKPNVHAEKYFKSTFGVTKGTRRRTEGG